MTHAGSSVLGNDRDVSKGLVFMQTRIWGALRLGLSLIALFPGIAGAAAQEVTREDVVVALEQNAGPAMGRMDAPVTLVEFSDFQCGYCGRFARDTLPKIVAHYVQTGQVRLVFRHLAILGEASVAAAGAAACAHDQGKFWEYHDTLFANRSPLAFRAARLKQYAAELHLDSVVFDACLDRKTHAKQVEVETLLAQALHATGTPAFLINGQLLIGAYPFETFQRGLDALLGTDRPQKPSAPRP